MTSLPFSFVLFVPHIKGFGRSSNQFFLQFKKERDLKYSNVVKSESFPFLWHQDSERIISFATFNCHQHKNLSPQLLASLVLRMACFVTIVFILYLYHCIVLSCRSWDKLLCHIFARFPPFRVHLRPQQWLLATNSDYIFSPLSH